MTGSISSANWSRDRNDRTDRTPAGECECRPRGATAQTKLLGGACTSVAASDLAGEDAFGNDGGAARNGWAATKIDGAG
jgi:hypothetical protein